MNIKNIIILSLFPLVFIFLFIVPSMNKDRPELVPFLEKQGYSQVKITGYAYFGCSKESYYKNKFTAVNSQGNPVEGVVCEELVSGAKVIKITN